MCVDLLKSGLAAPSDTSLCLRLLDTLRSVLYEAAPLSLRNNPHTNEWAISVVEFLISVAGSKESSITDTAQAESMRKRAVMMLLNIILQTGSLRTALLTIRLLGLHSPSAHSLSSDASSMYLTPAEYHEYFSSFSSLCPVLDFQSTLNPRSNFALSEWDYRFPNAYDNLVTEVVANARKSAAKKEPKRQFARRGRGRGGRVRTKSKKLKGHVEDSDDEEGPATAYDVSIACDGAFLYICTGDYGLAKVGTGYGHTRRGYTYIHLPDFSSKDEPGHVAFVAPWLYYRSSSSPSTLLKLSPQT